MNDSISTVELVNSMGSAKTIVDVARVSFDKGFITDCELKAVKMYPELDDRDKRLIRYLWTHKHTTPFRHNFFSFHIVAPIFVLRQWMKHQVGCSWNEASGRYIQFKNGVYSPQSFRESIKNVKQGSGGELPRDLQLQCVEIYEEACRDSLHAYNRLLERGVCREQARMLLPLSLYTSAVWSCSLHALLHFFELRLDQHAQKETRDFAMAVYEIIYNHKDWAFVLDFCLKGES